MFDVLVCGNRESRCPTAAENGPAEVIKTSAKQTRSSAEPQKRDQTLLRADVKRGKRLLMTAGVSVHVIVH